MDWLTTLLIAMNVPCAPNASGIALPIRRVMVNSGTMRSLGKLNNVSTWRVGATST